MSKATDLYWIGASGDDWSDAQNWSLSQGGTSANLIPGPMDNVFIRNGASTVDTIFTIDSIIVAAEISGGVSLNFGPNSKLITNYIETSGDNPIMLSGTIEVNGDVLQKNTAFGSGGIGTIVFVGSGNQNWEGDTTTNYYGRFPNIEINKPSGSLTIIRNTRFIGDWAQVQGAVTGDSLGYVYFYGASTFSGNAQIPNLSLNANENKALNVPTGEKLTISGDIKTAGNKQIKINGIIEVNGDVLQKNTAFGSGGIGTIVFVGSGNQNWEGDTTTNYYGRFPNIEINKPSGSLTIIRNTRFIGDWTQVQGAVTGDSLGYVYFYGSSTFSGNAQIPNLSLNANENKTLNVPTGQKLIIEGGLKTSGTKTILINGTIELGGDIFQNNTGASSGGTGEVILNGSDDQVWEGTTSQEFNGCLPHIEIKKSGGSLIYKGFMRYKGTWKHTNGNVNTTLYPGATVYIYPMNCSVTGNSKFPNLMVGGNYNAQINFSGSGGTKQRIYGDLVTQGDKSMIFQGLALLYGDLYQNNTSVSSGGTGISQASSINFVGDGDQTLFGNQSALYTGFLPTIVVDKPSGTLFLDGTISLGKYGTVWQHIQGEVDPSSYLSEVYIRGGGNKRYINGGLFYNLTIVNGIKIVSDIEVLNECKLQGDNAIIIDDGNINLKGDLRTLHTKVQSGGNGSIVFNGIQDQTVHGSLESSLNAYLPNIKIDKPLGTLFIQDRMSVKSNWEHVQGNVNGENGEVYFYANATISGNAIFDNLLLGGSYNSTIAVPDGETLTVRELYKTAGTKFIEIDGKMHLQGDIVLENTSAYPVGMDTIIINGTGLQTWHGNSAYNKGYLPSIEINKTAGKLCLKDNINLRNDWIHLQGTVDTCCYETFALNILGNNGVVAGCNNGCQAIAQIDFTGDTARFLDTFELNMHVKGTYGQISIFNYDDGFLLTQGILFNEDSTEEIQVQQNLVLPYAEDLPLPVGKFIFEVLAFDSISGCQDTLFAYDTLSVLDVAHQFQVTANVLNVGADDSTGIIDISSITGGASPYAYSWSTGENTSSINNLTGGVYKVIITDAVGAKDSFDFLVSYEMLMEASDAFARDNEGHIIKHPEAIYDDELMVSKNKFYLTNSDVLIARFSGGSNGAYFSLGFDADKGNISNQNLQYEVRSIGDTLFAFENGVKEKTIGLFDYYNELVLAVSDSSIVVLKNFFPIHEFEVGIGQPSYYAKVGFYNNTKLLGLQASSIWVTQGYTDSYATLTKKLDAGYYVMLNDIKYKYKEKYNDNILNYKVYDWKRDVKMDDTNQPETEHKYGIGYYQLKDAHQYLNDGEFYTMEITNDKNEVYKMRFKFDREVRDASIPLIPFPIGGIVTGNLSECCLSLMKRCCYPDGLHDIQLSNTAVYSSPLNFYQSYMFSNRTSFNGQN